MKSNNIWEHLQLNGFIGTLNSWGPFLHDLLNLSKDLFTSAGIATIIPCNEKCINKCPAEVEQFDDHYRVICPHDVFTPYHVAVKNIKRHELVVEVLSRIIADELMYDPSFVEIEGAKWTYRFAVTPASTGANNPCYMCFEKSQRDLEIAINAVARDSGGSKFELWLPTRRFIDAKMEGLISKSAGILMIFSEQLVLDCGKFKMLLPNQEKKVIQETYRFPTPAGALWEMVTIEFLDKEKVRISVGGVQDEVGYQNLGFATKINSTKKPYIRKWHFLKSFAANGGQIPCSEINSGDIRQIQKLGEVLEEVIPIVQDKRPLEVMNREDGSDQVYYCNFNIKLPRAYYSYHRSDQKEKFINDFMLPDSQLQQDDEIE